MSKDTANSTVPIRYGHGRLDAPTGAPQSVGNEFPAPTALGNRPNTVGKLKANAPRVFQMPLNGPGRGAQRHHRRKTGASTMSSNSPLSSAGSSRNYPSL